MFANLKADIARYRRDNRIEWWEPSLWVIASYRFGRWARKARPRLLRSVLVAVDALPYMTLTLLTGIHLPRRAEIGPGLRIWHFGGIFLNPAAKMGANCTLRQNVCLGSRRGDLDAPVIGDNVDFGVGAMVLGKVAVGTNARIGASAVVLIDVPPGATAAGIPARIVVQECGEPKGVTA